MASIFGKWGLYQNESSIFYNDLEQRTTRCYFCTFKKSHFGINCMHIGLEIDVSKIDLLNNKYSLYVECM